MEITVRPNTEHINEKECWCEPSTKTIWVDGDMCTLWIHMPITHADIRKNILQLQDRIRELRAEEDMDCEGEGWKFS